MTRREFLTAAGLGMGSTAVGLVFGNLLTRKHYEPEIARYQAMNNGLAEITKGQHSQLDYLLKEHGALEVRVQELDTTVINLEQIALQERNIATQTAFELTEFRVQATAEAYAQDRHSLEEAMNRIPESLVHQAVRLDPIFSRQISEDRIDIVNVLGSGVVTSYDRNTNELILLTAGHIFTHFEGYRLDRLNISQPHIRGYDMTYPSDQIKIVLHKDSDIGIAVLSGAVSQPNLMNPLTIDEDWVPIAGEILYSLAFPGRALDVGFLPSIFKVVQHDGGDSLVITNNVVGGGGSGAAVAKEDGSVVGIFVAYSPLGSYILPIGKRYRELLEMV